MIPYYSGIAFFALLTLFSFELWLISCSFAVDNQFTVRTPSIRTRLPCSTLANYSYFAKQDDDYGMHDVYVQKLKNIPKLEPLSNEKECFHRLVPYELKPCHYSICQTSEDLQTFFNKYKSDLFFACHDRTTFSHCQEFYVMLYDTRKRMCSSFQRMPCRYYWLIY